MIPTIFFIKILSQDLPVQTFSELGTNVNRLVFRSDELGVGYSQAGKVTLLDSAGKLSSRFPIPGQRVPLYISDTGMLVTSSRYLIAGSDKNGDYGYIGPTYRLFSQRQFVFGSRHEVSLFGENPSCSFQNYTLDSAIGVSNDGKRIAYIRLNGESSILQFSELTDMSWTEKYSVHPGVSGIGPVGIARRHNDLVFIDSYHVAYIGVFYSVLSSNAYKAWQETIPNYQTIRLGPNSRNKDVCYLFISDLKTGVTRAACSFSVGLSSEMGEPVENTICPSNDNSSLYILAIGKIVKIRIDDLLKQ